MASITIPKSRHATTRKGRWTTEKQMIRRIVYRNLDNAPDWPWHIPLTQGKFALVDREDYLLVMRYNWYAFFEWS